MIELERVRDATNVVDFINAASRIASDVDLKVGRYAELTVMDKIVRTDFLFSDAAEADLKATLNLPTAIKRDPMGIEVQDERGVVRVTRSLDNGYRVRVTKHPATAPASTCYACRFLEKEPRDLDRCGVPQKFYELVRDAQHGGFAAVTGKTGSGKSTSMMAMARRYAMDLASKVVIIESPLEYQLDDNQPGILGSIVQIEIGTDLATWEEAMELLMWIRPRLIIIGEVTSSHVMEKILALSDAGHTVLFTLHTNGFIETVSRILSFFPTSAHPRIRTVIGKNLIATMGQRLVAHKSGLHQIMIPDVFYNTAASKSLIQDPEGQLSTLYSQASVDGEQLMLEDAVLQALVADDVSIETAFATVDNPSALYRKLEATRSVAIPRDIRDRYAAKE